MPNPKAINPKTGKRYDYVPPELRGQEAELELKELQQKIGLLKRAKIAKEAQTDYLKFVQFTMPHPEDPNDVERSLYEPAAFHKALARHMEEIERGDIRQLILTVPPRHGKTQLATKHFAAWYLGRNPRDNVAVASYSDTMAMDYGSDARAIMQTSQFKQVFPGFKLRRGGSAKDNIQTTDGGRAVFVGRGGALTGRGANCLLIDDIIKDAEEARSQTIRNQAWEWFTKVAMTRRMGKRLVVIIMTRWHQDDIVGRLTDPENPHYNAMEAKSWKVINLPAIAEDDDPLGRRPGEALWPERYDLDFLQQQQRLDPLGFSALYQQRPSAADGVLFRREHVRYYRREDLPSDLRIYAASDHAVSTRQRADRTCLLVVGVDRQNNIYLLDCFWERVDSERAVEAMIDLARLRKPLLWWAERGHISKSIGPFLRKRQLETGTFFTVREVTPAADKEQRAQSIAARMSMGYVWFPKDALWTERAVNELLSFPNGNHDDFVDAFAYIGLGLQSQFGGRTAKANDNSPKPGTFAYLRAQVRFEDRAAANAMSSGGFV